MFGGKRNGIWLFQFLIGNLIIPRSLRAQRIYQGFQFLIGNLIMQQVYAIDFDNESFNSL